MAEETPSDKSIRDKVIVARVDDETYNKLSYWSERRNIPKGRLTENALRRYIAELEHTFEYLIELVSNEPTLILQRDVINKVFKNVGAKEVIPNAVDMIKSGSMFVYDDSLDELMKRIKTSNFREAEDALVVLRVPSDFKPDSLMPFVDEFYRTVNLKRAGGRHTALTMESELKEGVRALVFVRYKKEGEKDGKK